MPQTLDTTEIIGRISLALTTMDGKALAELHNQVCDTDVAYEGDSIFVEVDE